MSKKILLLAVSTALAVLSTLRPLTPPAGAQQERCDSAFDRVVQAREQARPDLDTAEAKRIHILLKSATGACSGSGDAWYYRYLYARRVGDQVDANYALGNARTFRAEGLRRQDDPFAAPVAAAETPLPSFVREKWALVVGIGNFQYAGVNPLKYTAKDAKDFHALLADPKYGRFKPANVILLTDQEATTTRIKSEIEHLSEVAKPDDLVVIYLSTHGSPRDVSTADVNYIVTYDTKPDRLYTTSLPMVDLMDNAGKLIQARRVVVFLDTCFSGAATLSGVFANAAAGVAPSAAMGGLGDGAKALGFVSGVSDKMLSRGGSGSRIIITASSTNEKSWESHQLRNGIFTHFLIRTLQQNNGLTPINELFRNLRDQVTQRARAEKKASQVPMMAPAQTKADIRIGIAPQSN